jgi:hypothetical protein
VRGVFVWNERQFLLDQSIIKTRRVSDTKPPLPIELKTFNQWEQDYDAAILNKKSNFAQQLPADILLLFNWRTSCVGLTGIKETAMDRLQSIEKEEKTEVILNRFLAESKTVSRYNSVLDLKEIFNIDKYQIDSFTRKIQRIK